MIRIKKNDCMILYKTQMDNRLNCEENKPYVNREHLDRMHKVNKQYALREFDKAATSVPKDQEMRQELDRELEESFKGVTLRFLT